ncbi:hypothetical protein [Aeoliella sp. SH292]|uniref:hypothetical protein n=1 Tax=Aeoliella sp. SH292 TaxID=3454464 RepID=UPI003F9E4162
MIAAFVLLPALPHATRASVIIYAIGTPRPPVEYPEPRGAYPGSIESIVRDTVQGLDFLHAGWTRGMSFDEVSSQLAPGGQFEGFRYASTNEVLHLIDNNGFSVSPWSPSVLSLGPDSRRTEGTHQGDQLSELVDMFGFTRIQQIGNRYQVVGFTDTFVIDEFERNMPIRVVLDDNPGTNIDDDDGVFLSFNMERGEAYETTASWLVRTTPTAGDFNADGIVNLADYTVWRDNLGGSEATIMGVGDNSNPDVTIQDYYVWRDHFGDTQAASPYLTDSIVAPEPTSFALSAAAVFCLAVIRKRY